MEMSLMLTNGGEDVAAAGGGVAGRGEGLQPREKLIQLGTGALSNAELLAILLRTGFKGCPVLQLAERLLSRFGNNLRRLFQAGIQELAQERGIGETKAVELSAAFALSRRMAQESQTVRPQMSHPEQVAEYMYDLIGEAPQESLYALLLDNKSRLIHVEQVSLGLVDRSLAHPREVFRTAVREVCSFILLCHNHPSGVLHPSKSDILTTKNILLSGEIMGIHLVDHIIIGGRNQETGKVDYFSMRTAGYCDLPKIL